MGDTSGSDQLSVKMKLNFLFSGEKQHNTIWIGTANFSTEMRKKLPNGIMLGRFVHDKTYQILQALFVHYIKSNQ